MPRALVVADDLTGATDTAHAFATRGYETAVQVDPNRTAPESTVLAVNTDSRYVDPETAAGRVRRAIAGSDARLVYKKVDSTLRGNVEREVDAAIEAGGFDLALVAPAAPAVGRLTACGAHLVDGRLLSETEYADDPNPPPSARPAALFEGATRPVERIGIEVVASGPEPVRETLAAVRTGAVVTCDATHDRHLAALGRAGRELDRSVLYVGSSGLAEHVALPVDPGTPRPTATGDGGALGIVGSVSETSLAQIAALPAEWVLAIDPEALLSDPERAGREAGRRATARLATGEHAVVTAAPDRETVGRTLELGRERGLTGKAIRTRVATALAGAARPAVAEAAGLFVTGGDVAMAAFDRLGVRALSLSGADIEAGIPIGRIDGGPADGVAVVTKAGGFGGEVTVINCLRTLGEDHE
ncbi:four-carbon acid sugar kinase family protein [Halalkalicoccus jeotgali]|uniref:YgbK domain protein n=1 Tax=Halalkalicoccus jeotgali (strain DSM 18796 / CECT 7217 / JCM 14584 / KCTC 4019 / B3) TaxID=795797 RepID=D8JA33_HALJB|nr:four-carbon acid sugar kinase family protein [Halalkalicoccus jeotgali]ADJ14555.1 ygbK domain protein [Halalkalicoccus jeotgali B3]ELY39927.1 ygbK domain-containing protein [Halalkalicoccus jeotgali B3]